jgi:hypothetical protein
VGNPAPSRQRQGLWRQRRQSDSQTVRQSDNQTVRQSPVSIRSSISNVLIIFYRVLPPAVLFSSISFCSIPIAVLRGTLSPSQPVSQSASIFRRTVGCVVSLPVISKSLCYVQVVNLTEKYSRKNDSNVSSFVLLCVAGCTTV